MEKGYIHVYTGNGKGKTTSSLGIALRAVANGYNVAIGQFVKAKELKYSEVKALEALSSLGEPFGIVVIEQFGKGCCCHTPTEDDIRFAQKGLETVKQWIESKKFDVLILDELAVAIHLGILDADCVCDLLKRKPEGLEVVITGRHASEKIIEIADLVSEIKEIKHYYSKGVLARAGIDR